MQTVSVTTPFGQRPMTLALVKRQVATNDIKAGKKVEKWKVFRDASEAREELGLKSSSLAVLDALLSFYPENELRHDAQLVVFPSNAQLVLRAHGMAGATLRRHIALLVDAGLIVRKDSANGKRYARKNGAGEIENAFGFDLSPILARSEELAIMAQKVVAARSAFRRAKENLTICRRDVRKLITAAIESGADGQWKAIEAVYIDLVARIPRSPTMADIANILDQLDLLRDRILNLLDIQSNSEFRSTIADHNERHIQNSKSESFYEFETNSGKGQGRTQSKIPRPNNETLKAFPLGVVLKACPQIVDYGPAGAVGGWRDLMSAAVVVRSMLGVSPSAYQEACETMGSENAAVAIACILERAGHINSAGGYLRDLTNRTARGEFSLGPMVTALLRSNGQSGMRSA